MTSRMSNGAKPWRWFTRQHLNGILRKPLRSFVLGNVSDFCKNEMCESVRVSRVTMGDF